MENGQPTERDISATKAAAISRENRAVAKDIVRAMRKGR
jgi:hypothetical protein